LHEALRRTEARAPGQNCRCGNLPADAFALASSIPALAQQWSRPVRIGILTASWGRTPQVEGLVAGLVDLGYRENEDFVVAVRFTEGDVSLLPATAKDMVDDGIDVLVTVGPLETDAARQATSARPIVFVLVGDPVGQGLVESYARPGGNVTGIADQDDGLPGRRLQLFRSLVPRLQRVLFPYNEHDPYQAAQVAEYRRAAERLGITLVPRAVTTADDAIGMMRSLSEAEIDGVVAPRDVDFNLPGLIIDATTQLNIPSMFDKAYYARSGGLASYGASAETMGRQAALMIDKIIDGTDPAEIPVETYVDPEFVVNLRVADKIGMLIPPEVLYEADWTIR
jgi:putative ABC transport system substrate-binding protein